MNVNKLKRKLRVLEAINSYKPKGYLNKPENLDLKNSIALDAMLGNKLMRKVSRSILPKSQTLSLNLINKDSRETIIYLTLIPSGGHRGKTTYTTRLHFINKENQNYQEHIGPWLKPIRQELKKLINSQFKDMTLKDKYPNRNIGFKATNQDMTCRDYQYSLNETFKHEKAIQPCESGFHLCLNPIHTLEYYNNIKGDKRFFIVEYGDSHIEHSDKLVTNEITLLEEIDLMEFINANIDSLTNEDWSKISWEQILSEDFIRQHKDLVNWNGISWSQKLSEDFIREHRDLVNWNGISWTQKLSEDFKRKFKDKLKR